ncbi:MAG TPA: AbrB family transcriptional regulator [Thermoanaerobaculia bacterium]|nr:AbrB family transcriptional regulator [Thermoanaerobaculia bacterium]
MNLAGWEIIAAAPVAVVLGAYLGLRIGIPAGAFTGAMIAVGILLAVLGFPSVPAPDLLGQALQVMVGVLVGFRISRESLRSGARTLLPATILAALFLATAAAVAAAAVGLTGVSPTTALFAAAPGGLTEMATIGASVGADGPAVAAVHLSRLLLVIFVANFFLARSRNREARRRIVNRGADEPEAPDHTPDRGGPTRLALIIGAGVAGGVLGLALTPLPAGGVVGSLLGAGLARLCLTGAVPEGGFSLLVQAAGGGIIGLGLSAEFFATLLQLAGVALIVNATQMLAWAAAAFLLVRAFRFDPDTATLAAAPGGMGTLLSVTGETGADLVAVAFTHLFRVTATIVVVPLLA